MSRLLKDRLRRGIACRTKTMNKIEIYTKGYCQYCARAMAVLSTKGTPVTRGHLT